MNWQPGYYQAPHSFEARPFQLPQLDMVIKMTSLLAGTALRVRLQNLFTTKSIWFEHGWISLTADFKTAQPLTMGGTTKLVVPSQTTVVTDPLALTIQAGQPIYLRLQASHPQAYMDVNITYATKYVNATWRRQLGRLPGLPSRSDQPHAWFNVAGVDVLTNKIPQVIEITGDSLVEMGMLTQGLFDLTLAQGANQVTWLQTGIAGNRLLSDAPSTTGNLATYGQALLQRFQLATKPWPVALTVVNAGLNDLLVPLKLPQLKLTLPTATQLITSYQQLAHQRAVLILTLSPSVLATTRSALGEQQRQLVNEFLRQQSWGVDLEATLSTQPGYLKAGFDFGDHLHWNLAAGQAVAKQIWAVIK